MSESKTPDNTPTVEETSTEETVVEEAPVEEVASAEQPASAEDAAPAEEAAVEAVEEEAAEEAAPAEEAAVEAVEEEAAEEAAPAEEAAVEAVEEEVVEEVTEEAAPSNNVDNNVNFEKEREFFESNKDNIKNRIASLQREVEEERRLSESLASRDVVDSEELNKIRTFLNNNKDEINTLHATTSNLESSIKDLVISNKAKAAQLRANNQEYAELVDSADSKALAAKIKSIRTILSQLEAFLVQEGVQGPNTPN